MGEGHELTCALEGTTLALRAAGPGVQVVPAPGQGVGAGDGVDGGPGRGEHLSLIPPGSPVVKVTR